MMPVGITHLVTFFEHPRLYSLRDGSLIREWPELPTGTQVSSIQHYIPAPPPLARDADGRRFAVGLDDAIVVVTLS
jgi:hypothetical protein